MSRQSGQSVSEYGIIIGLVAIIVIPGLMFLGNSTSSALNNLSSGIHTDNPELQLAAGGALGTSTGSGQASSNDIQASNSGQNFQASYDPKTGKITYELPESSGGGTSTTSVEGATQAISNEFVELANNWKDSQGRPLSKQLKEAILAMAATGFDMAAKQSPGREYDLFMRSDDFVAEYKAVDSQLGSLAQQSPEYAQLQTQLANYAGVISYVNYSNFLNPAANNTLISSASSANNSNPVKASGTSNNLLSNIAYASGQNTGKNSTSSVTNNGSGKTTIKTTATSTNGVSIATAYASGQKTTYTSNNNNNYQGSNVSSPVQSQNNNTFIPTGKNTNLSTQSQNNNSNVLANTDFTSNSSGQTIYYNSNDFLIGTQPKTVVGLSQATAVTSSAASDIETTANVKVSTPVAVR